MIYSARVQPLPLRAAGRGSRQARAESGVQKAAPGPGALRSCVREKWAVGIRCRWRGACGDGALRRRSEADHPHRVRPLGLGGTPGSLVSFVPTGSQGPFARCAHMLAHMHQDMVQDDPEMEALFRWDENGQAVSTRGAVGGGEGHSWNVGPIHVCSSKPGDILEASSQSCLSSWRGCVAVLPDGGLIVGGGACRWRSWR